jgi:tryptophanyl-tRNA synthetase
LSPSLSSSDSNRRIVSGMRVSGQLHLGHYHGVLKNWLQLQHENECFFFAADLHGLTTHYANPQSIEKNMWDMLVDWLAVGIDPNASTLFIQSWVPEHAELNLLLSMNIPLSWLERVPTYKDQMEKLKNLDLQTYGFLGYPVLMSADILLYRAGLVPVGEDQLPHIEVTREIARRFNHFYGREPDFEERAKLALKKIGNKTATLYQSLRKRYQEQGDKEALETGQALVASQKNLTMGEQELLVAYLSGSGKEILLEPTALLTPTSKFPGLDGQKMSKSYNNTILLRDPPEVVKQKINTMPTDPARVRRSDPGEPEKCPVWNFHQVYSDTDTKSWVQKGCRSAGIGCLECKRPVIDAINAELKPIQEQVIELEKNPKLVRNIVREGTEKAQDVAQETMQEVKRTMGLLYQ